MMIKNICAGEVVTEVYVFNLSKSQQYSIIFSVIIIIADAFDF